METRLANREAGWQCEAKIMTRSAHHCDLLADAGKRQCVVRIIIAVALLLSPLAKAGNAVPRYFAAKPGSLAKAREQIAVGDTNLTKALKNLVRDADGALGEPPPTVTDKTSVPPSGDKHDYMSLAPYYWPDPKSKNGLPYIRHDGKVNPESRDKKLNDSPRIRLMGSSVETLALAYFFSGEEKYAAQAANFLRTWFLNPATRMNPNFKFAQAVRGENDGRGTGIMEARHIAAAADAALLLTGSKSWTDADQQQLDAWLNTYLDWLLTSKPGRQEHAAANNHGTWYDVQAVELALCLGRNDVAKRLLEEAKQRRIAKQIEPDGRQPLELARTAAFSYSIFNLSALAELATLGEHAGVDLWNFKTDDGRSIRAAIEFLLPYYHDPAKKWPYPQIHDVSFDAFAGVLHQARLVYAAPEFQTVPASRNDSSPGKIQLRFTK